jgi:hypothetical protein
MSKRIYNLIYAVYFKMIGEDKEYEDADPGKYEQFAGEMLEQIQEYLTIKGGMPDRF